MTVVAFDLDGTLEDSRNDMVSAVARARRSFSLPDREPMRIRPHVNRGMDHLYRTCFDEMLDPESPGNRHGFKPGTPDWLESYDRVRRVYGREYGTHIADETRLYDGILEALQAISSDGHQLALVTNKPESLSEKLLEALGIREFFQVIVGGDTCDNSKPHPEPLQYAVRQCGGSPAIMVGDSQGDIKCARAAAIPVIWCAWGYADSIAPLVPDRTANRPEQLPGILTEVWG